MKVKYLKGGLQPQDYPFPYKPEVAVVGRSNAGKSSFINALTNQKTAKVSGTPGKTRMLNFFELNDQVYMVDCPGYGFATGNREEVLSWRAMLEVYLTERQSLKGVLVIMDIRRQWTKDEEMLKQWFDHHEIEWVLILNKADKLSRSEIMKCKKEMKNYIGETPVFALSSAKKTGFEDIHKILFKEWS